MIGEWGAVLKPMTFGRRHRNARAEQNFLECECNFIMRAEIGGAYTEKYSVVRGTDPSTFGESPVAKIRSRATGE